MLCWLFCFLVWILEIMFWIDFLGVLGDMILFRFWKWDWCLCWFGDIDNESIVEYLDLFLIWVCILVWVCFFFEFNGLLKVCFLVIFLVGGIFFFLLLVLFVRGFIILVKLNVWVSVVVFLFWLLVLLLRSLFYLGKVCVMVEVLSMVFVLWGCFEELNWLDWVVCFLVGLVKFLLSWWVFLLFGLKEKLERFWVSFLVVVLIVLWEFVEDGGELKGLCWMWCLSIFFFNLDICCGLLDWWWFDLLLLMFMLG